MDNNMELGMFVIGITQAFKMVGMPTKYLPFMAIFLGGLYNFASNQTVYGAVHGALLGAILTGLVSVTDDRLKQIIPPPPSGGMPLPPPTKDVPIPPPIVPE
jgi:hypothetical protein